MSYVKDTARIRRTNWSAPMSGKITRDVASIGDPMFVAVEAFSNTGVEEVEWGPCSWAPEWGTATLPKRGDRALICLDVDRIPWVLRWVPAVYVPPSSGGGGGTSDVRYTFTQSSASLVWTVTHNLGLFPAVMVVDNSGDVIGADVHYVNNNQLTITFAVAQAGKAYLS